MFCFSSNAIFAILSCFVLVFLSNYCVNIRFLSENTASLGGYLLFEWALAFLSVVVGYTGKGSVEVYGEFNQPFR